MTAYWWETIAHIFCILGIIFLAVFLTLPFPKSFYGCVVSLLCAILCYIRTIKILKKQIPYSLD